MKVKMRTQIKRKRTPLFLFMATIFSVLYFSLSSYALSDDEIINILVKNKSFFSNNGIFKDVFRWVGWTLVKGGHWLIEWLEGLYLKAFELISFSTSKDFTSYLDTLKPFFVTVMILSLTILGFMMIFARKKLPNILHSLLIGMAVISSSFYFMDTLNTATTAAVTEIIGENTTADTIVRDNLYDIYYIDVKAGGLASMDITNGDKLATYKYISLSSDDISNIEINEVMNNKNSIMTSEGKEIIGKQVLYYGKVSDSGNDLTDIYNGFGWNSEDDEDLFNKFYYRYKVDWVPIFLLIIAYAAVYLVLSYKVVRIGFELGTNSILAVFYSGDLTGLQKTKRILNSLKDAYIVLIFTAVLIKLYSMFNTYINYKFAGGGMQDGIVRAFFMVCGALAVIDAPNLIEKLTGIDAGLGSGMQKLMAGAYMMRGLFSSASGAGNSLSSMFGGMFSGFGGDKDDSKADKSGIKEDANNNKMPESDKEKQQETNSKDNSKDNSDNQDLNENRQNASMQDDSQDTTDNINEQGSNDDSNGEMNSMDGFQESQPMSEGEAAMNQMDKDLNNLDSSGKFHTSNGSMNLKEDPTIINNDMSSSSEYKEDRFDIDIDV